MTKRFITATSALLRPSIEMTISFDGRPVPYAVGELDQIALAYGHP
jgi:hypothetical protein